MTIARPATSKRSARQMVRHGMMVGAISAVSAPALAAPDLPLMPMPRSVERESGELRLEGMPAARVVGCKAPLAFDALARFERDLKAITGASLKGIPLPVAVHCAATDPKLLSIDAREAYRLSVDAGGVTIDADGETGVVHALATLRQLIGRDGSGPVVPFVRIDDAPRFAWRGLMIDTARHFMSVPTVKRQIDAMELAKLNVLHLHLSDNEGFRLESRRFPKLTAAAHGEFYTQEDMRDLVRYAGEHGIRVVPEFDMPGHNLAAVEAYPSLAAALIDPADPLIKSKGVLDPSSERTYQFLKSFFAEVTPIFPDRYFHIGGDEVSDVAWKDSVAVDALKMRESLATKTDVEAWFHARVRTMLATRGKITIGWDETAEHPLPKDAVVQVWRTSNPTYTATAAGNRVIVSAGYYLDQLRPADMLYAIDPFDTMAYQTMSQQELAGVRRNPAAAAQVSDGLAGKETPPLTEAQERLVLGAEAPLWAELVSDEMLDGRLWPRALALGERFWSPRSLRDPNAMYARLLPAMDRLRSLGLQDEAHRARMVARIAPDDPAPAAALIGLVAPVRMFAHMKPQGPGKQQELVDPADAASTDGSPARLFRVAVDRYLRGDSSQVSLLRAQLAGWRDNAPAFEQIATGRPALSAAIPTARDIAALGILGLEALESIERHQSLTDDQVVGGRALLGKLKAFEAASGSIGAMAVLKQPPADLIVLNWADVQRLLDRATSSKPN